VTDGVASTDLGPVPLCDGAPAGEALLVLRADALRLLPPTEEALPHEITLRGVVTGRRFAGDHLRVQVRPTEGPTLTVPVWRGPDITVGDAVAIALDPCAVHRLPDTSVLSGREPVGYGERLDREVADDGEDRHGPRGSGGVDP
jgi:hypothetical protein